MSILIKLIKMKSGAIKILGHPKILEDMMKKLMIVFLATTFLSLGVQAQNEEFELQEHEVATALMFLDRESNLPVCRLSSNELILDSAFVPEDRVGDIDTTSIGDMRVCQTEDVLNAFEEKMLIGMVVSPTDPSEAMLVKTVSTGTMAGCFLLGISSGTVGGIVASMAQGFIYDSMTLGSSIAIHRSWPSLSLLSPVNKTASCFVMHLIFNSESLSQN